MFLRLYVFRPQSSQQQFLFQYDNLCMFTHISETLHFQSSISENKTYACELLIWEK
jgi:hypothetical protein